MRRRKTLVAEAWGWKSVELVVAGGTATLLSSRRAGAE